MKKMLLMAVTAISVTMSVKAQDDALQPYFELDQLPQLINIMPPPPAFDSPEFAYDVVRYGWGKQQRQDKERVELAIADAEWDDHTKLYAQWKDAFGLEITETGTPEIWKLMETSLATTDPMRKEIKAFYHRQRPFERFDDSMPSHEEDNLRGEGSYPSGHSLRGWGISLLLAQIAPSRADEIFSRGWDYCNSRVIVGAHWQSDVDASRTAASIGFCALQGSEAFIAQMKKAQQEYQEKTGSAGMRTVVAPDNQSSARIYTIDGTAVDENANGIIIEEGKKIVKP
ncbi:MAG: phosphatase PAP2 family protein [Prevotella sp.]|nr:phosphatase PAP2 family protein [Prevotella sp.]